VQFRPVPALAQLVRSVAERHGLALNETYKNLAAMAVVGLDVRYFDLVAQMAAAMGGANAFVLACLQINATLNGAALAGQPYELEPDRSLFLLKLVKDFLEGSGRQLPDLDLWFLREQSGHGAAAAQQAEPRPTRTIHGKPRRKIRPGDALE
jgi:hypothetical protein